MIRYMIKNNFKIMFRNPVNILLYVLCPILVSSILISAFSSLLESYEAPADFSVGYSVEEGSRYAAVAEALSQAGKGSGVTFVLYESGEPEQLVKEYSLGGFVKFTEEGYTIYESKDSSVEGAKLEYMISAVFNSSISGDVTDIRIPTETPEVAPSVNSTDYYGLIELVYFAWCPIICAAGLFSQEKKNRLLERYRVSNLSSLKIYLGRVIPVISVVSVGIGFASLFSALILGVHWGNIAASALLLLLSVIAATTLEMMIYEISQSMIATIIISFTAVWIMGYIGGSFETYMFSAFSDSIKNATPMYHVNRALVELSGAGHSDHTIIAVYYLAAITIVTSLISVLVGTIRRKDRA